MGKTACVGSSHHASSPKLFNCCHARPWKLIIACCIFISFDKLPTNGSCIFVKEEIWSIDLRAIFFPFHFPVSVVNFSVWRTQATWSLSTWIQEWKRIGWFDRVQRSNHPQEEVNTFRKEKGRNYSWIYTYHVDWVIYEASTWWDSIYAPLSLCIIVYVT
jgi:hypothetical protein